MFSLMLYEGIILTLMIIPAAIFYKDNPPTPTCASSGKNEDNTDIMEEIKKLMKNKNYLAIWFDISMNIGIYTFISAACS